jgi:hypothetical protein
VSEPLPFPTSGTPEHPSGLPDTRNDVPSGEPEAPSRLPESRNGGAWHLLHEAAQRMGVGSDAVRKRIAAGTVEARKHGSRWEVWLPAASPAAAPERAPSGDPESAPIRVSGSPDEGSGDPEWPSGSQETTVLPAVTELGASLVALVEKLQEENRQLAGQVGFLQAQRQVLEERVRLLEAPKEEPVSATAAPPPAEDAPSPERGARRWWQRLLWG